MTPARQTAGPGRSRLRRWLRRLALAAGAALVLLALFVGWVLATCFAEPPALAIEPAIARETVTAEPGGRRRLGASWFLPRPGRSLLHLEGDPFTLGYANAALTADLLEVQERALIETVREHFSSPIALYGIALVVLVNNRSLPDYVAPEFQLEILGLSRGAPRDAFPELGPRYHRILNYHAAHDISHWVMDQPVLGCTALAVRGARAASGHLLIGRNFDWEAGDHFDRNKVILRCVPDDGHAFLSVVWPGMAGAVTGINDARIYCSLNGAHSEHQGRIGRPVSLVVREVLQRADSLAAAIDIVRAAPVFVADSFLLADGETGEAAVVEKTPASHAVRRIAGDHLLQANHFESAELAGDAGNRDYMANGTSVARRARLQELVDGAGALDPAAIAAILRDRRGPGGGERALGHRGTINPMIATHAVVCDATTGVLWVSRGPHQLGAFDAYTIDRFGADELPPIAADPALEDGSYAALRAARDSLDRGTALLAAGDAPRAAAALRDALGHNPGDPQAAHRLGDALAAAGDRAGAAEAYRAAIAGVPPFAPLRAEIELALAELTGSPAR